jgi:hypothetical protein
MIKRRQFIAGLGGAYGRLAQRKCAILSGAPHHHTAASWSWERVCCAYEGDKSFTFRVEKSTFPNWDNTDQQRTIVSLTADELTYTAKVSSRGGIPTTTWKRVR